MIEFKADRLKILALHWLRAKYPEALLIPEFAAAKYGDAMIDVAAILPLEVIGIEIKGDGDSMARLQRQGWVYARTASKMYLLPAPSLLRAAEKHCPLDWGLLNVASTRITGHWTRPRKLKNSPAALLDILWKEELIRAGSSCGISLKRSEPVYKLADQLAEAAPLLHIRMAVTNQLLGRDWSKVGPRGKAVFHYEDALPEL